jgi:hypothetical protein
VARRQPLAICVWTGKALVAKANRDREALQRLEPGSLLEIDFFQHKTDEQSRYLHAMLRDAEDNSEAWTADGIKSELKWRLGLVKGIGLRRNGETFVELKSTADFDKDEMVRFIEAAERMIETEILPGVDMNEVRLRAKAASAARVKRGK